MPRWVLPVALFAALFALASPARADFPSVDARRFTPSVDPAASLYLEPTPTPGPWEYNGAVWLGYAFRPAVLRDPSGTIVSNLVSNQVTADLTSNLGLGQRFALGFDLPMVVYQHGDDDVTTRAVAGRTPPAQALGDLALYAKGNIVSYSSLGGFGLSTLLRFTAPTGNTASYLGEGASTGEIRMLAEYKLIAVAVQGTAGFLLRFEERDVLKRTFNHEVPWGAAISLKPQALGWDEKGRWTWVAEIYGNGFVSPSQAAQDRGQKTPVAPIMAGLSARYAPSDVSFLLGAQTSLTQAFGSPPLQVIASVGWAPRAHDVDHDGVPDDVDQCPELAEDRDGFEDADGCPDWDNDDDGVGDAEDRCPTQKEDTDGFEDADGCPDPDNDKDGILDQEDACPNEAGERSADPKMNGCPDKDKDGVVDKLDKCPNEPEDKDGFEDADGCPDPDNDKDGVPDAADACPNVPAGPVPDPRRPGCPATDKDGDTFDDSTDKCPSEAETFNGVEDDDGCPDHGGKPLVVIREKGADISATFAGPVKWKGTAEAPDIDPASVPLLRALALELNRHPTWIVAVGVRPKQATAVEQQAALARSFVVVETLRRFTFRDGVAETIGWKAVAGQADAAKNGFGVLVLAPPPTAPEAAPKK
jgi:OmpA-OmpF porin, OOP family